MLPRLCVQRFPAACVRAAGSIAVSSPDFSVMRAGSMALVDKTSAIADLLNRGAPDAHRVFFARPRKFGKSLTLSIAGEMLAAGALPPGVAPWPGYTPVDVRALFGGLQVHERLLAGDASLRGLLQRPHFVVKLGLGGATSGAKLEAAIFDEIAVVAGAAFGGSLEGKVRLQGTPMGALGALVAALPSAVPVALLVDEYDAAIIQDVAEGNWASAREGIKSLRSLFMSTKSPHFGSRIERCLVTGVARFARASLFSGANNFTDLTGDPLLSRVLGFSETEIRATYPEELQRLGVALGKDTDGAMQELTRWYNGYCFDDTNTCFNPFPVLKSLAAGRITGREMEGASGINWLGLTPADLVHSLVAELQQGVTADTGAGAAASSLDVADLERRRVRAVPLLLQLGLLSSAPGRPQHCQPPNEYASASLQRMLSVAMEDGEGKQQVVSLALAGINKALALPSPAALEEAARAILLRLPSTMFKESKTLKGEVRESGYHAALAGALLAGAPRGVAVELEASSLVGRADIVLRFGGKAAWVLELGVGVDNGSKLLQAQVYGGVQLEPIVLCCSVVVSVRGSASASAGDAQPVTVTFSWSQRTSVAGGGHGWKSL